MQLSLTSTLKQNVSAGPTKVPGDKSYVTLSNRKRLLADGRMQSLYGNVQYWSR